MEAQAEQMAQRGFAGSNLPSSGAVHGGGVDPHIAAALEKAAAEARESLKSSSNLWQTKLTMDTSLRFLSEKIATSGRVSKCHFKLTERYSF